MVNLMKREATHNMQDWLGRKPPEALKSTLLYAPARQGCPNPRNCVLHPPSMYTFPHSPRRINLVKVIS